MILNPLDETHRPLISVWEKLSNFSKGKVFIRHTIQPPFSVFEVLYLLCQIFFFIFIFSYLIWAFIVRSRSCWLVTIVAPKDDDVVWDWEAVVWQQQFHDLAMTKTSQLNMLHLLSSLSHNNISHCALWSN